ncbi:MAG TPA: hypothetical protein V6D12_18930, partial [Candidatus Obscuribacterales bacterium]
TSLYKPGTSIGSPEYVAPEQVRGQAVFASDIYSLGVTCIHLLTQMSPFDLYDINEDAWIWRQFLTSKISDDLGKILDKMLQSAPSQRYQSADEVLKALNSQPNIQPSLPQTPVKQAPPPIKSSPATPVVKTPSAPSKGKIDDELAEVSSQFLTPVPSKTPNQGSVPQKPPSSTPPKSKSQIDIELEELKSQFFTPKNPPQT